MTFLTFELGCKLYKTENVESSPVQKKIIYLQSLSDYLWPHKSKLCHWNLRFIAFSGSFGLKTDLSRRIFIVLGFDHLGLTSFKHMKYIVLHMFESKKY